MLSRKIRICQNLSIFVDYPLKMKISTEFLQSFCTRDAKKSEIFDRFGRVLFQCIGSPVWCEVPFEGLIDGSIQKPKYGPSLNEESRCFKKLILP